MGPVMISTQQILQSKILVVDDQKLHSLFLKNILVQEGFTNISCINDPLKVSPSVLDFQPDLLILDLLMPQLDGFQIMSQLAEFRQMHYLPILVLSADKSSSTRLKALQSGATDILSKPYETIEILFRIRNMIEMRILHLEVKNQNVVLEKKVFERTKELRDTQLEIIRRLAQAAECRDSDTGFHIIRMSHYCMKLGEALGLNEAECELILNSSPLHDVGKIGIPDCILLKPGPLTAEEFEVMKTHTTIGAQLLAGSDSPVMQMAQKIAATHHENWDGTGYPEHLKGDDIPLEGQICSICDVFDALTSRRPYKQPWPLEKAMEEIALQRNKKYSARLVDRFMDIRHVMETIQHKYS